MIRTALALALLTSPALAADTSFTKEETQAVFTLGQLTDAAQRAQSDLSAFAASPAAKSAMQKMNPSPEPPATKVTPGPTVGPGPAMVPGPKRVDGSHGAMKP